MRELKFRVWDKKRKCYAERIQTLNTSCPYHDRMNMPKGVMTFSKWVLRRYVIEQFTGLKDENGKEIYEGDIVTLNGEWEEIDYVDCHIVTFKDGCFRIGNGYENEAGSYLSDWRVIGNIHENPELLEEEE